MPDGGTNREHLAKAARTARGPVAIRAASALAGPPVPESVAYLREWLYQLVGRSGVGFDGAAPLSYGTIADWARLTGVNPTADDVAALFHLDHVLRSASREHMPKAKPADRTPDTPPPKQRRR